MTLPDQSAPDQSAPDQSAPGRIIGTEIEFGIVAVGQPLLSSVVTSTQVVKAYTDPGEGAGATDDTRWDYASESPLRDARGFDLGAARAYDPSEFGVTNRVLTASTSTTPTPNTPRPRSTRPSTR